MLNIEKDKLPTAKTLGVVIDCDATVAPLVKDECEQTGTIFKGNENTNYGVNDFTNDEIKKFIFENIEGDVVTVSKKTKIYYNYDENNLAINNEPLKVFGISQNFKFPTIYFAQKKLNKAAQNIAEVETDKAVVEIPTPKSGKVEKLAYEEGDTMIAGTLMMVLSESGETQVEEKIEDLVI